jgi:hypothetical protein
MTKHTGIINKIEIEKLKYLIHTANTMGEILIKIGVVNRGSNYRTLKQRLERENINYSELKERSKNLTKKMLNINNAPRPLSEMLVIGKYESSRDLKIRLLKEGIFKNECSICGLSPIWNNKPLVLQLDHINGNRLDNRLENLRIVCMHCHSQTETFGTKKGTKHKCAICHKSLKGIKKSICKKCYDFLKTHKLDTKKFDEEKEKIKEISHIIKVLNRPNKETLIKEIQTTNFVRVGKKYGVTDNAVRKWCIWYGINPKTIKKEK